jgi:hypothetical protein
MPVCTVTIAGPERHDMEKPYDYLVEAPSEHAATAEVQRHFQQEQATRDTVILAVKPGIHRQGYLNDIRPGSTQPPTTDHA